MRLPLAVLIAVSMAAAGAGRAQGPDKRPIGSSADDKARKEVVAVLERQAAAWNRGDLEEFVSVYAQDATFVSPTGLTRGRQAVLDRYRKRYPDKAAMGTLSLEVLEDRIARGAGGRVQAASIVARWTLSYPDKPAASGHTLLVLHARDGRWVIVQDASM